MVRVEFACINVGGNMNDLHETSVDVIVYYYLVKLFKLLSPLLYLLNAVSVVIKFSRKYFQNMDD